jgi:hypothetical protein
VNGVDEEFIRAWKNDRYTVWEFAVGYWTHLSIKRNDQQPIHDWRHLQQIKNDICGPDREAVELYPASSRVIDSANQYHLWVLPKGRVIAVGATTRTVTTADKATVFGAVQRDFEEGISI